jgi:hypothetical protein
LSRRETGKRRLVVDDPRDPEHSEPHVLHDAAALRNLRWFATDSGPPMAPVCGTGGLTSYELASRKSNRGTNNFSYPTACSPAPTAWTTTTPLPLKGLPFVKGAATVTASTTIADPIYPLLFDTGSQTSQVGLSDR